ncbi:MAG: hypothetical protein HY237_12560 [Acidobacteria bacterium]|nr:hypothetical protein [Acidobacteriota bacterium]
MTHFDEMTCLLYLEGQLERPRALELSAHAESCAECRALLRALERESRLLTQALVEEEVLGTFLAALALPPSAGAAETKHVHVYTLPVGQTVHNDLIVAAGTARIDGTVDGDLIVFCQSLTINGHITGDVISFSQMVRINGQVDGNVRAFANMLTLTGPVAKNVTAFAGSVEFDSKSRAGGGMILFAGDASLDGRMNRDLLGFIGKSVLNGFIGGNARVASDRLTIGPSAEIAGKATYQGARQPEVSPQAKLASPLEVKIVSHRPDYTKPRFYIGLALRWGVAFLFGVLIASLVPGFFADVVRSSRRYGMSFAVGSIAAVSALILACVSVLLLVIGLAGGLVVLMLFAPALYASQVFVGTWLGEQLLGPSAGTGEVIARLALGLLVIRVLGVIPFLGWFVWLAVLLWGLGALTLAIYRGARQQAMAPAQAPAL